MSFEVPGRSPPGAIWLCALALGCGGSVPSSKPLTPITPTPLCDASDPAQVVAPQRIALLTSTQFMNIIRLVSDDVASVIVDDAYFPVVTDLQARYPPSRVEQYRSIPDATALSTFLSTAQKVGEYARDNFTAVTGCPTPATDACATAYLDGLARKAYRRKLTPGERDRFTALYVGLESQVVNGQQVTLTVEQATGFVVQALLLSPQLLWRWEVGAGSSSSPPGVFLTDAELASHLSLFLTDQPPDDALLADADAGLLRPRLAAHVDRILASETAHEWLSHVMQTYFFLNQLPATSIDESKFPVVAGGALYADLATSSSLFLDDVMWNGKVTDLVASRKAFVNSVLASSIYDVPVPPGATPTIFVETTLPADQRAGMLTDAGFITTRARSTGVGIVPRGLAVKAMFTCVETIGPPESLPPETPAPDPTATAQEQAAYRAGMSPCRDCHASFDPYGLALDWYDVVGRYRTVDELGRPIDGHTTLPAEVGGTEVDNAVELAKVLSRSDVFTNCMAKATLQYALLDAAIELPLPSRQQAGCAAAGVAHELRQSSGQSFTDLYRAAATSTAFVLRAVAADSEPERSPLPTPVSIIDTGGVAAPPAADALLTNLASRRSVLDFLARELDLLRVGPADVRAKLDNHYSAVVVTEDSITNAINAR